MLRWVLGLGLFVLPVVELTVLIKTGQQVGFWATLGLVLGAGMLGAAILSRQSLTVLRQTQVALAEGRPPIGPALDGAFLLLAGGLLMFPGLVSDAIALLLLVPPIRRAIARWSVARLLASGTVRVKMRGTRINGAREPTAQPSSRKGGSDSIIEGEFKRLDERNVKEPRSD